MNFSNDASRSFLSSFCRIRNTRQQTLRIKTEAGASATVSQVTCPYMLANAYVYVGNYQKNYISNG